MAWRDDYVPVPQAQRRRVLARGYCEIRFPGCWDEPTEVDHIVPGTRRAVSDEELQAACGWCHGIKTRSEQSAAAKTVNRNRQPHRPRRPLRRRHPFVRGGSVAD